MGQALVLAHELPAEVDGIHAHFLHTPASVARYAARIRGLPWSCSAHAKDIWTSPEWDKAEKLAECRWLVTCTRVNAEHLASLAPAGATVELVYHGLDLARADLRLLEQLVHHLDARIEYLNRVVLDPSRTRIDLGDLTA